MIKETLKEKISALTNEYQLVKAMSEESLKKNETTLGEQKNLVSISMNLNEKLINLIKEYVYL